MRLRSAGIVLWVWLVVPVQAAELKSVEELSDVRGSIVFRTYCVLCHGPYADGKGRASKNLNPPPANLTVSTASDSYKEMIIRKGGAAIGRSPFMPPWGQELTDEQIKDVITYLRVINISTQKNDSLPRGGGASSHVPPRVPLWSQELTDEQIEQLLAALAR